MRPADIAWGQRTRRVWAELSRAQTAGEAMPSMRQLARRCKLPSCSTAQRCVETLVAMGVTVVAARHEGVQQRAVTGALRVVTPFEWECYL